MPQSPALWIIGTEILCFVRNLKDVLKCRFSKKCPEYIAIYDIKTHNARKIFDMTKLASKITSFEYFSYTK